MNHHTWNYIGQSGKVAIITLQHNTRNGDLVVYYNLEVVWAERGVRNPQVINFFIDDELCKIHIELRGINLAYFFEIDKKTNTPLNKLRRRTERRDFGQGVFFLLGLMAAVALFMAAGWGYNRYYDAQSLAQNGIVVRATLAIHPDMAKNNCVYTFSFSGAPCTYYTHLPTQGDSVLLPYQLPARTGDVVLLRFDPTEIDNHTLDFEHITDTQLERLCERVRAEYATAYPNLGFQTTDCFVKTVYRLAGVYGLANIYQRNTPITQNWYHNQLTFALMQQRFDYKDEVTECR